MDEGEEESEEEREEEREEEEKERGDEDEPWSPPQPPPCKIQKRRGVKRVLWALEEETVLEEIFRDELRGMKLSEKIR